MKMRSYHTQLRKAAHASLQALVDEWGAAKSVEVGGWVGR